jgi:drug/metabolite transporter (DMT)-like permease
VLLGAALHAAWNVVVKRSGDPAADLATLTLAASVLALPALWWVAPLPRSAWPYLIASNVIHVGYYATLAATYRHADLSVGYPLMRGTAPLIVALAGALWLGEWPAASTWLGVLLISAGVVSLAFRRGAAPSRAVGYALLNASMIATYTLVDAAGARTAGDAWSYVAWMFFLEGLPFALFMRWRRGPSFTAHLRSRWRQAVAGGAFSASSYAIAVWAMTVAPMSAVAALRETSVIFALGFGALWLGERLTVVRWVGVGAVAAGAVALRL